tara:strand:+ start:407 stop:778 length:372 start_codon:yes stop_codon:yes gene_type:complete
MGGRLPVDGKKVHEYRITLGTYERERLNELVTAFQIQNVTKGFNNISNADAFNDPIRMIAFIEAVATLLEVAGIETPLPTPVDAYEFLTRKREQFETEATGKQSILDLLFDLWKGEGTYPGGY